jgi:hypothetical protein
MTHRDTNGLRHLDQLRVGFDELQWAQDERIARLANLLRGGAYEPGWIGRWWAHGEHDFGWEITELSTSGDLYFQTKEQGTASPFPGAMHRDETLPFIGVDSNGHVLESPRNEEDPGDGFTVLDTTDTIIKVPDDGVWRTLVAIYSLETLAPGRMNLVGGSNTVTGSFTEFTRFEGVGPRKTKFRIDAADTAEGNEGTYEFSTITDDTNATITPAPPRSESKVPFRMVGEFFTGAPADPDIHNNVTVRWELRTRTVTPPADGALIAYDIMRDTGATPNVNFIDRRHSMTYRRIEPTYMRGYQLAPWIRRGTGAVHTASQVVETRTDLVRLVSATGDVFDIDMAPAAVGADTDVGVDYEVGLIAAILTDANQAEIREFVPWDQENPWRHPNGGSAVTITLSGTRIALALTQVPSGSGNTHLLFLADETSGTGGIHMRSSTDNGATWSGASTTIWDGTLSVDDIGHPAVVLTRLGRLIVVARVFVDASSEEEIRYIFSDDYGATWSTNSNAGFTIQSVGEVCRRPSIDEDDLGNLWTSFTRVIDQGSSSVDHLRLVRGQAVNDPVPNTDEAAEGWIVGPEHAGDGWENNRPGLIACPGGEVIILHNIHEGAPTPYNSSHWFGVTYASRGRTLMGERLLTTRTSGHGGVPRPIKHGKLPDGRVIVAFVDPIDIENVYAVPFTLHEIHRNQNWFGGF